MIRSTFCDLYNGEFQSLKVEDSSVRRLATNDQFSFDHNDGQRGIGERSTSSQQHDRHKSYIRPMQVEPQVGTANLSPPSVVFFRCLN